MGKAAKTLFVFFRFQVFFLDFNAPVSNTELRLKSRRINEEINYIKLDIRGLEVFRNPKSLDFENPVLLTYLLTYLQFRQFASCNCTSRLYTKQG